MAPLPPPSPLPEFVYKITPDAPPDPLPEQYPLSELDRQDSFVHLSTAGQLPITADLFFQDRPVIYVLKLRLANFPPSSVKWDEVDGTNGCPHLYGNFGARDVADVRVFRRAEGQSWREALESERAWLQ